MSAAEDLNELDKRIAQLRILSRNIDIYTQYLESGGFREFKPWVTYRFTEEDFTCWPPRQAGYQAERDFQPVGETE